MARILGFSGCLHYAWRQSAGGAATAHCVGCGLNFWKWHRWRVDLLGIRSTVAKAAARG